jgi:hypothetical protein
MIYSHYKHWASAEGAEIITFSTTFNVLSCSFDGCEKQVHQPTSTSTSFHFKSAGFLSAVIQMFFYKSFPS